VNWTVLQRSFPINSIPAFCCVLLVAGKAAIAVATRVLEFLNGATQYSTFTRLLQLFTCYRFFAARKVFTAEALDASSLKAAQLVHGIVQKIKPAKDKKHESDLKYSASISI
jgi:hypothetical protein